MQAIGLGWMKVVEYWRTFCHMES